MTDNDDNAGMPPAQSPEAIGVHTAGLLSVKWKVSRSVDGDFLAVYPDTGRAEFPICKKPEFMRDDVWSELARAIATVPEMREALEDAIEFIAGFEDVNDGDDGRPEPNKAMILNARLRNIANGAGE